MKKSQLKEVIKSEIKYILSEDMNPKIYELRSRRVKATIDDLNQYLQGNVTASGLKDTLQDTIKFLDQFIFDDSLNEISSTEANAQLMEIVEHQKQILNILKELKKGADLDAAIKIIENEIGKTLTKVKNLKQIKSLKEIQESEEMTDTEMNAKAEKEAKEADKKAKKEEKELKEKINKIKSLLKKNKQEVSRIAKLPRNKRTKADDEMFDNMINKTKELKKLEKDLK